MSGAAVCNGTREIKETNNKKTPKNKGECLNVCYELNLNNLNLSVCLMQQPWRLG